ncbi:hypothetical protein HOO65_011384 [Ceratocystis lukuohia]|uniref:EKC/KEOPS complex subunit BUD32 n=1 Tax=Ceratocystis lukuohia TaxID=2019550 RepID=A0ABR4MUT7_9PEZI
MFSWWGKGKKEEDEKKEKGKRVLKVVDNLNLEYGITHQDIAPRNLLIDESTDSIMLFDFNFAARMDCPSPVEGEEYVEDRNDIKGVIFTTYEIITQDNSLRNIPHEDQNIDSLTSKWVKHLEVKLDHPGASYQLLLQEWQDRRAGVCIGDVARVIDLPASHAQATAEDHLPERCTWAASLFDRE